MSLTGNGSKSIRRQDVKEQKSIAVGLKKLVMAHKATLGDTGINLSSLSVPSEMSSLGFLNPNSAEILAANLLFYRNNLRIVSSHKGLLMDFLSYDVASSSRINFTGFTAEDGEIFVITYDDNAKTGVQMVDAAALNSTGTLSVGVTDYNVGTPFEVNKYPSSQVGAVLVFRNGQIQFRNTNNGLTGGNYREVDAGGGLGVIIRFNSAPTGIDDNILVVGNGLLAYKPDGSVLAEVENLAGQLDRVIPTVAALAGVPETDFQGAPNNVDLKAFGDRVLQTEQNITALNVVKGIHVSTVSGAIGTGTWQNILYSTIVTDTIGGGAYNPATGVFTVQEAGWYTISASVGIVGTGVASLIEGIRIMVAGGALTANAPRSNSTNLNANYSATITVYANVGTTFNAQRYTDRTGASYDANIAAPTFTIIKR